MTQKIILDCDPGHDDVFAIWLAAGSPAVDLRAITTVGGNGVLEHTTLNARIALHVRCIYGRDPHHITEAEFKAVARALREATENDPRVSGIPSTKGAL